MCSGLLKILEVIEYMKFIWIESVNEKYADFGLCTNIDEIKI